MGRTLAQQGSRGQHSWGLVYLEVWGGGRISGWKEGLGKEGLRQARTSWPARQRVGDGQRSASSTHICLEVGQHRVLGLTWHVRDQG